MTCRKVGQICLLMVIAVVVFVPGLALAVGHGDYGCDGCHTPHHATAGTVPLWNGHETALTFTVYGSASLNATVGQPDGSAKLCLACHDGSNTFTTHIGSGSGANFGTDLSGTHPISFVYNGALATADGGLKQPTDLSSLGGTIAEDMLFADKMQCVSCHDIHATGVGTNLLRGYDYPAAYPNGPKLCRICHIK